MNRSPMPFELSLFINSFLSIFHFSGFMYIKNKYKREFHPPRHFPESTPSIEAKKVL